jgi:pantetheine-phosphate adenylyltransferase
MKGAEMPERKAIYPGSFDPITNGHLDVIKRGSKLFDQLTIAVSVNPNKNYLFTPEERKIMIDALVKEMPNVDVVISDELVVDLARRLKACFLLRGIRTFSDYEYEFQMAFTNRTLAPDIETVLVMPSEDFSFLSSSMVKQAVQFGGDLSKFVPDNVISCLKRKLIGKPKN